MLGIDSSPPEVDQNDKRQKVPNPTIHHLAKGMIKARCKVSDIDSSLRSERQRVIKQVLTLPESYPSFGCVTAFKGR